MYKQDNKTGLYSNIKRAAGIGLFVLAASYGSEAMAAENSGNDLTSMLQKYNSEKRAERQGKEDNNTAKDNDVVVRSKTGIDQKLDVKQPEGYASQLVGEIETSPGEGTTVGVYADSEKGRAELVYSQDDDATGGNSRTDLLVEGNFSQGKMTVTPRAGATFGDETGYKLGVAVRQEGGLGGTLEYNSRSSEFESENHTVETDHTEGPTGGIDVTANTESHIAGKTDTSELILRGEKKFVEGSIKRVHGGVSFINSETDITGESTADISTDYEDPSINDTVETATQEFDETVNVDTTILQGGIEHIIGEWQNNAGITVVMTDAQGDESSNTIIHDYASKDLEGDLKNVVIGGKIYIGDNSGAGVDLKTTYVTEGNIVLVPGVGIEKRSETDAQYRVELTAIIPPQGKEDSISELAAEYNEAVKEIGSMGISEERKAEALATAKRDFDRSLENIANTGYTEINGSFTSAGEGNWQLKGKARYQLNRNWAPMVEAGYGKQGGESSYGVLLGAEYRNDEGNMSLEAVAGPAKKNGESGLGAKIKAILKFGRR